MNAKQEFAKGAHREAHEKWVISAAGQASLDAALLAFVQEQPRKSTTPSEGWDAHSQLIGARRFIDILTTLHEKEEPRKIEQLPNLRPPR